MTSEDRAQLLDLLHNSRSAFLSAISDLSADQWIWKPGPDRWSIGELSEHIVLTEYLIFLRVRRIIRSTPDPDWQARTQGKRELLERALPSTEGRAASPEWLRPTGCWTIEQARNKFSEQRTGIDEFACSTKVALEQYTADHPMAFIGTLNAFLWMLYVPLHTLRHERQIIAVKSLPGYPSPT